MRSFRKDLLKYQRHLHGLEPFRSDQLLDLTKHPNVMHLTGSFIYHKRKFNIYEHHSGVPLSALFREDNRSLPLSLGGLLLGVCGLCSVLEELRGLQVTSAGVAYWAWAFDSSNIFYRSSSTSLFDGFAFQNLNTDSERLPFSMYEPPERSLRRPVVDEVFDCMRMDVWALGCLLSDLIGYTVLGRHELAKFHAELRSNRGLTAFHRSGGPSSSTVRWLARLEATRSSIHRKLVQIIGRMLSIDPSDRPPFREVTIALRSAALWSILLELQELLSSKGNLSTHHQAALDRQKFLQAVQRFCDHASNNMYPEQSHVLETLTIFQ